MGQAKGYPYHRYPLLGFLLLLLAIDFARALRAPGWRRWIAGLTGAALLLFLVPVSAWKAAHFDGQHQAFITALQQDLNALGGPSLNRRVQCLDTTEGCINTLYQMRLVQSTGLLYDCYFVTPHPTEASILARSQLLRQWTQDPPEVFVVTSQMCLGNPPDFAKLHNWPELDQLLQQHYTMQAERTPPGTVRWWSRAEPPGSYRLYIRRPR